MRSFIVAEKANVQPAYAKSFGVASVHLSRHSKWIELRKILLARAALWR